MVNDKKTAEEFLKSVLLAAETTEQAEKYGESLRSEEADIVIPMLTEQNILNGKNIHTESCCEADEKRASRLRVAAYIRVSTDMTDQENSYEVQERYFTQLLEQNPEWVSAGIYSDYGLSGTSKQKRTGFKRILRHCEEDKIDRIVCKSISRFARNTADFLMALNILQQAGVTIFFEREGLDLANTTGTFIVTTLSAIAQEESRNISANIRWGNEKRFSKGDVRNQDIYGYRYTGEYSVTQSGYRYRSVELVETEAEVIQWIFEQVASGISYKQIARELNRIDAPRKLSAYTKKRMQKAAKGQLNSEIDEGWTGKQISSIVRNERYTGDVLIQKTYTEDYLTHRIRKNQGEVVQYLVKDHHVAIISYEVFEEAKRVRERNARLCGKKRGKASVRALSGRLICGHCGRYYNVRNVRHNPIWFCPSTTVNNGKMICHNEKVYEEQIVRMFRKAILERFHLAMEPVFDNVEVADIMSGRFEEDVNQEAFFSNRAQDFVQKMAARLENMQRTDSIERDRTFIKHQILAVSIAIESTQKRIQSLTAQKETIKISNRACMNDDVVTESIIKLSEKIQEEEKKLFENKKKKSILQKKLEYLESYWEELENDYDQRKQTIEWMKTLPTGKTGMVEFFNGMTSHYMKAFALSIIVHSPWNYTIRWFDDTQTDIKMDSNIENYRYTAAYFDRRIMREKIY